MNRTIAYVFALLWLPFGLDAQNAQPTPNSEGSDPKAKAMLDKVRKKFEAYTTVDGDFSLEIEIPEQPKEVQKGKFYQKGAKYRLELNGQTVICDGKSVWMILPQNKEIQINSLPDLEEDESILSPKSLFRVYEKDRYAYAITNEYSSGSRLLQQIEFKPLDRDNEFSKLRLTVDKNTASFVELKSFSKDGSRYTLILNRLAPNKPLAETLFTFNKANYPGYHIEDLRE